MDTIIDSDSVDMGSIPVRDTKKGRSEKRSFILFTQMQCERNTNVLHSNIYDKVSNCRMERSRPINTALTAGRKYNKIYTSLILAACFMIPAAIMLVAYAYYGMAPFGMNSVLIMDMSNQYNEFYCGLKHIGSLGDVYFSWAKALGGNYIGVFAYYLSSPLSIVTLLCPNEKMPICLLFLTCVKIGLCGLTFGIFLNKRHTRAGRRNERAYIILFSICYAMMSYNVVYSLSLMWLDAVIWLPLVILGIETVVLEDRCGLLIFSFAGIFISTYYLSYMVGIFSCIYLLYAICVMKREDVKIKRILLKFAGSAAGAAALGAWLLVPTFFSLLQGKIGGDNYKNNHITNYRLSDLFKKLVLGSYDGIKIRVTPFLYCGIIVFILFFAYFFIKSISRKQRLFTGAITLSLLLSTFILQVDKAWHVFQLPNWFPYRYAFLLSFMMVLTASEAFLRMKRIGNIYYSVFAILILTVYSVFFLKPYLGVAKSLIQLSVVFLMSTMLILYVLKYLPRNIHMSTKRMRLRAMRTAVWIILICLTSAELSLHAEYLLRGLNNEHRFESYDGYYTYKKHMQELVQAAENDDKATGGSGFYRLVQGFQRNYNEGIGLGYQSIAHFSSAYNRHINTFLHNLGFSQAYLWSSSSGSTLVTDSLLSVKYILTDPDIEKTDSDKKIVTWNPLPMDPYERVLKYETTMLYRNQYALAPCYAVSDALYDFEWGEDPIESQNSLLKALAGGDKDYFVRLEQGSDYFESKTALYTTYLFYMPYSGPLYAYFPKGSSAETPYDTPLIINNEYALDLYRNETDCVLYMGTYEKGEAVTLTIKANMQFLKTSDNVFYMLDMPAFTEAVDTLKEHQLEISEWGSGYIKGNIDTGSRSILFTGITYDKGWRVFVDGIETECKAFEDGLLYFETTPGIHEIELKYYAEGERPGIAISVIAWPTLAAYAVYYVIRKKRSA